MKEYKPETYFGLNEEESDKLVEKLTTSFINGCCCGILASYVVRRGVRVLLQTLVKEKILE